MTANHFESITESGPLLRELRARIERDGPITFRDFMDEALYHPKFGYYSTTGGATGRGGDFVTSPEVHPVFGALVGRTLLEMWEAMGSPPRFDVVEQGGGTGSLARDILRWAHERLPAFASTMRYTMVERSAAMRAAQERAFGELELPDDPVAWCDELPHGIEGVLLSNELIDAFPVHRVVRESDGLREVFVDVAQPPSAVEFVDRLMPLSAPRLREYFSALGVMPGEGCYAEVNLDAVDWVRDVAKRLSRGYVLTFDYGQEAAELYTPWRRDGTLACFYRQSSSSDPYQRIGKQDMTSSVDFTTLKRVGEDAGLTTIAMTDQSSFLVRLGIGEGVGAAAGEMEEYFARRKVLMDLVDPGRLGRTKVLLQGKGVPATPLLGFRDN